jgi:threonine aldolase
LKTGWAIERDGQITKSHPSAEVLGAYLDAVLAGASVYDADDIAKVIERRPRPTYEGRQAVFSPNGAAGAFEGAIS